MSTPTDRPRDVGLPNERTGLAWQRTMLSGLACSLLVARLLADVSLAAAVVTGALALLSTAALGGLAIRRFRRTSAALDARRPVGGGVHPLLMTVLVVLTSVAAVVYVLTG